MKRQRQPIETPAYAAMMRRMVRAYGERVGDADPVDLRGIVELQAELEHALRVAVRGQRQAGFTWREIGEEGLGVTKEAALMRFRKSSAPDCQGKTSDEKVASGGSQDDDDPLSCSA